MPIVAEVTDFAQVKRVADDAAQRFGRIDTWVQLAAVSLYAPFEQHEPDEFHRIIDVNLVGAAYGAHGRASAPQGLGRRRAHHDHVGRGGAGDPVPRRLRRVEARPARDDGGDPDGAGGRGRAVSVTNVMPASIDTPFFEVAKTRLGVKPRGVPPVYEPDVVARAILFAAEHPSRDLAAGGAGKSFIMLKRLSPSAGRQR